MGDFRNNPKNISLTILILIIEKSIILVENSIAPDIEPE